MNDTPSENDMTRTPHQSFALPAPTLRMGALLLTGALALVPFAVRAQTSSDSMPADGQAAIAAPDGNPATAADAKAPATKPVTADADAPEGKPADQPSATDSATAEVAAADGGALGRVMVANTASGALHVTLDLTDIPPGKHAVHIHETGQCDAPDFKSAGGHLAAGKAHGANDPDGMHPGDLPNVTVGADGTLQAEFFTSDLTMAQVMDDDGSAFVMHSDPDDYTSQPAGNAGDRIACGVFAAAS